MRISDWSSDLCSSDLDGHHRGLIEDDAASLHVDQGVRRTEVDRHIGGEHAEQTREHGSNRLFFNPSDVPRRPRRLNSKLDQADITEGAVFSRFTSNL